MRQFGFDFLVGVAFSLVVAIALVALPIAVVLTLGLIRWFRFRVKRSMQAAAGWAAKPESHRPPPGGPQGTLEIEPLGATRTRANAARAVPLLVGVRRHTRQVAAIYAAAAGACPLLLAGAWIVQVDFSPTDHGILKFALLFSLFFHQLGTPLALAPIVILKKQPRFLLLAVLALVTTLWAWDRSIGVDSVGLWLMIAGVPTAAVLLLNTRRLRAVGPVVFAATLLLLYGLGAGVAYAAFYALDAAGPVRFVRQDLAELALYPAAMRYFVELWSLPLDEALAEISALRSDPLSFVQIENVDALTTGIQLQFYGIWLIATVVGAVLAWLFVRWLARSYRARRASDQMLTLDVVMMLFAVPVVLIFSTISDWILVAGALAGFAGYKLVARWGLRRRQRSAPPVEPRTLLLLRVFGFDRRAQRLLEDLGQRWRCIGPIRLIAGTDLAHATIEPHEFFEFLNGRLSRAFIRGRDDLEGRLSESSAAAPDPDGLYRVEDFFCHEDTWRMTVSRLAREADAVLMDLRGFGPANRGCVFEIEQLIASVPLRRVVLLVDGSTDTPFLDQTLRNAWHAMPSDSPNAAVAGEHRLRILKASSGYGRTLDVLLGLLCEGFDARSRRSIRPSASAGNVALAHA